MTPEEIGKELFDILVPNYEALLLHWWYWAYFSGHFYRRGLH